MISERQIERLLQAGEFRQVIDRILSNGRCRSVLLRQTLIDPEVVEVAAVGLALQRLCEISYRPTAAAERLALQLISLQRDEGFFGSPSAAGCPSLVAATAIAIRALIAIASQGFTATASHASRLHQAIEKGLDAIAASSLLHRPHDDDASALAIVLWQLGDVDEFRQRVDVDDLLELLDATGTPIVQDELCRFAHAVAA